MEKEKEIKLLHHGDLVVLEHVATRRNLHSHREPAPLSKKLRQVTGYGEVSFSHIVIIETSKQYNILNFNFYSVIHLCNVEYFVELNIPFQLL